MGIFRSSATSQSTLILRCTRMCVQRRRSEPRRTDETDASLSSQNPLLPVTVQDQLRLYQTELHRVKKDEGSSRFSSSILRFASSPGVLADTSLLSSLLPSRLTLILSFPAHLRPPLLRLLLPPRIHHGSRVRESTQRRRLRSREGKEDVLRDDGGPWCDQELC